MSTRGLQATDLFSERDDRILFSGLSFALLPGEILQLAGPNGAGKTSLLRIIAGLSSRFEGELLWDGTAITGNRDTFHRQLLYLGHGSGIKAVLSPLENLRWSCALRGITDPDQRIFTALARVGLAGYEHHPCMSLSAGQQRRVSLARLFCTPAVLWVLDEPYTAIDQRGVAEIEQWIQDFASDGGMVLLTSHQPLNPRLNARVITLGGG